MATTSIVNNPPTNELLDPRTIDSRASDYVNFGQVRLTSGWQTFFSQVWQVCLSLTQSGTTAQRPTKLLWVGRPYFDKSLGTHGKPIWVASVTSGTATWVDATSTVV